MRKNNAFWKRVSDDYKETKRWPKWKQLIIISAVAASSGKFNSGGINES